MAKAANLKILRYIRHQNDTFQGSKFSANSSVFLSILPADPLGQSNFYFKLPVLHFIFLQLGKSTIESKVAVGDEYYQIQQRTKRA